jgi:hypothetical protein
MMLENYLTRLNLSLPGVYKSLKMTIFMGRKSKSTTVSQFLVGIETRYAHQLYADKTIPLGMGINSL